MQAVGHHPPTVRTQHHLPVSWSGCPMQARKCPDPLSQEQPSPAATKLWLRRASQCSHAHFHSPSDPPASLIPLFPPAASHNPCIGALTSTRRAKAGCRPRGQLRLLGLLLLERCRGDPGRTRQDKEPSHSSSRSPGAPCRQRGPESRGQAPAVSRGDPHAPSPFRGKEPKPSPNPRPGRCPGRAALLQPRPQGRARRPRAPRPIRKIGRPASAARGGGGGCC